MQFFIHFYRKINCDKLTFTKHENKLYFQAIRQTTMCIDYLCNHICIIIHAMAMQKNNS